MKQTLIAGFAILTVVFIIDGLIGFRRNKTLAQFFLLGGKLRLPGFVGTILSTNLSLGNFLIFVSGWCYLFGWSGLFWFVINLTLNALVFGFFLPKFRTYVETRNNSGTVHEYLSISFAAEGDPNRLRIRWLASIATVLCLLLALVFELHLVVELIAPLIGVGKGVLFGILTVIICFYAALGGFRTVVSTDIWQSIALFVGTACMFVILGEIKDPVGAPSLATTYPFKVANLLEIGWTNILGIVVVGSGWFLVAMDNWQRMSATRSAPKVGWGFAIYTVLIICFGISFGWLGMVDKARVLPILTPQLASAHTGGMNPLADFLLLAQTTQFGGSILIGFVALALLMAALSTADTFLIVSSHSLVSDVLLGSVKKGSFTELGDLENRAFVGFARSVVIGMGVFVTGAWVLLYTLGLLRDPISFFFIAYSVQFALYAPVLFSARKPQNRPVSSAVLVSVGLGILVAIVAGFGFWWAMTSGVKKIWHLEPSQWFPLTPVLTLLFGLVPLLFSRKKGT